jgi:hypothetical protein
MDRGSGTGYRGEKVMAGKASGQVPLGQTVAYSTVCGPGGSRTVMKSGGQGMHGAPAPGNPPPQRKTFD